ncbi:protein SPT2 homolog [Patiria miniata]|uniref:Protein SPT2 homolog n=1 Tax=Patiria miniata TaxID=46514 RepID=A0A913Z738_PATMI|nr:protein SPT2 homolog [Patiria miniata]
MDFQELLNIAAENNKKAQKEVTQSKRYTTAIPPPKKEKRLSVDRAAIRARLEKKQQEAQQKASEEEAKKQQLLKLRAETKKKGKNSAEKPKTESNPRKQGYDDQKHEQKHQSFMKKVQKVADRTRREETDRPVTKAAPDRPTKPKKAASAPKGPMSYEQLLALAANQQKGSSRDDSKTPTRNDTLAAKPQPTTQNESKNHRKDDMAAKKALAARKLGEARREEGNKPRKNGDLKSTSTSSGKTPGSTTSTASSHPHRTNGKLKTASEKQGIPSRVKKPETVTSKPTASTAKTKHSSSAGPGKTRPSVTDTRRNGAQNSDRAKLARQELERKGPPAKLHQSRVQEYFERKPVANRPRIVPPERSPPRRQSKLDSYYDRAPSSSSNGRPQAGLDRRGPSGSGQVPRKRPGPPPGHPSFRAKRGRLLSEEESDYEDDGFIDDTPLEEGGGEDVSHYIKEIFGYDKSKYEDVSDWQLRNMEASYREVQQEEARTARLGMQEDLEDMRREREELKRLKGKAATKKKRR